MKRSFVFILILLITMAGGCIFSEDEEAFKVSGTICNTTGSGMESVSVAIEGKINKTTESSSNGTYSFEEIGEGEYKITPFSEDFTFIPESNIFTVTDNDIDGLDFTGTLNTYTVSGTVFDINGTGLSDVCVYLSGSGGNFNTTTVANGDYTFEHIVKGEWTVTIQEDGATFTPEPLPFTISDTDETERNFTITGYSVSGTILDSQGNGLEGITVQISGSGGNYNAVTDTNGMYTFNDVSNGEWTLTPMHDVYSFLPESLTFTVSGSKLTGKDFTLTAFSVSGTILDSNSNALEGVTVTLSGTGGDYTTTTDSNGDYTFENIMTGEWTLTPEKNNYSFLPVSLAVTVSSIDVSDKNFIGTFLDYFPISDGAYWIYDYTCLLYTSPSPRDGLLSRMPSSA